MTDVSWHQRVLNNLYICISPRCQRLWLKGSIWCHGNENRSALPEELCSQQSKVNLDVNTCWVCSILLWGDISHLPLCCRSLTQQLIPPLPLAGSVGVGISVLPCMTVPPGSVGCWPPYVLAWLLPIHSSHTPILLYDILIWAWMQDIYFRWLGESNILTACSSLCNSFY